MPSPSPSPLPGSSKLTFVTRDQALPLPDQIQNTRGDLYDQSNLITRIDGHAVQILEQLQEHGTRITTLQATVAAHHEQLEAQREQLEVQHEQLEVQHEQLEALTSMSQRIIEHLERMHAPPQPSAPANQNGT